jgi:TolB-like protein/DNA-binding winged helix-turn-helix (wHTH) protein/Tfp pilus assembly protein PilF
MDLFAQEHGSFRWGCFTLDPRRRSLSCDGKMVKLAERLFDVLLYLVSNHGRVVERDELLREVWAGRIVEDNNVSQAIFELRKVLKAGGNADRSIITVPGRGFRFAEPVTFELAPPSETDLSDTARPDTVADQAVSPGLSWWRGHVSLGIALFSLVIAVLSLAIWVSHTHTPAGGQMVEKSFDPPAHSVAVLAFDNMSGDPNQAYFSDGLSEQLIDSLTQIEAIEVAGRVSSFSFRGSHATIGDIARALNVSAILSGSVRRAGNRVVVTAQLTNARNGFNMWSTSFNRDPGDVVTVQTEIAQAVVRSLQGTLAGGDSAKLTLGGTANTAAYDFYLRGTQLEHTAKGEADHRAALAAFDRAIALDPGFARAYGGRSKALSNIAMLGAVGSSVAQHQLLQDALSAADRVLALAPGWGQAHSLRAWVLNFGLLDHEAAEREMEQALLLTPGSAAIESNYANIELAVGHLDRAVDAGRRGTQIDPLSVNAWGQFGRILFMARRYDEAAEALHHAAVLGDGLRPIYVGLLGGVLLMQGQADAARSLCAPAANLEEKEVLAIADQRLGRIAEAEENLAKLRADQGDAGAFSYAEIYAQWGRKADALTWLETAARLRDPGMAEVAIDPMLDPIRGEPKFRAVQTELAMSAAR